MKEESKKEGEEYWVMDCELPLSKNGEALLLIHNDLELGDIWSWKSRTHFDAEEAVFSLPILIEFERRRGYQGSPVELLDVGVPIMSDRLYKVLLEAGVTSLDVYPASLVEKSSRETYLYFAYNIVGGDQKLFRLEENVNAIMVSQHIKNYIESKHIDTLQFIAPKDYVQL